MQSIRKTSLALALALCLGSAAQAQKLTTPKEVLGFDIGDDYMMASYTQLTAHWKKLAAESPRMKLVDMGPTAEGRRQYMAILTSPENMKKLDHYKEISQKLAHAEGLTEADARKLAAEGKAIIWIDGGLHATETVGSQQLMQFVWDMVSKNDAETVRLLNDCIILAVQANPDGQEIVANWYMREKEPTKRSLNGLPRLYAKYIGHDDNRDFYMSNMPETTNMNKYMFQEWFPEVVYNHHQTGPAGAVIFMPPFRDPFNYTLDPLVPLGIEAVGTAMHSRLVAEGKGGSAMRSGANYSTWWNGGLRTVTYFHNMIGLLTEIIGGPNPMQIPLVPEKQLPQGDWPLPVTPQMWHYKQSIAYEMSNNRAVLDIASRYRETFLFNLWRMGMNSIERGSKDNWTVTPKRIEALKAANAPAAAPVGAGGGGRRGGGAAAAAAPGQTPAAGGDAPMSASMGGLRANTVAGDLYTKVLHDPKFRDARAYIIPSTQDDFATAAKFMNTLIKNGITIERAKSEFTVNGKSYPAGSYVINCAQAFRPHILDMFEPQDHPNDFRYPGGPPIPPYDITGWTLAFQMGVKFDRIVDLPAGVKVTGPFEKITKLLDMPEGKISGPANPTGYLISHRENNSFILANRLLKAGASVYWLKHEEMGLGTGTMWVPTANGVAAIMTSAAKELGVNIHGVATKPTGEAMQLKPIRIGLYDQYGGSMPSGWTRWIFEQFEFPYELVYPKMLDAGDLRAKYDVLVFPDGAIRRGVGGRGGGGGFGAAAPENVPAEYQGWLGRISEDVTIPQLKKFTDSGGSIVTIGSSTSVADLFGIPVKDYLTEKGPDGRDRHLAQEKFYIPGALLKVNIDNTNPLAYGMPKQVDVVYDNSPVFKLGPDAAQKKTGSVAWFSGPEVLDSGWAWGQQYLDGGTAIADAKVGEGHVVMLGPEVAFRAQPHATFKLLFNGLFVGTATDKKLD